MTHAAVASALLFGGACALAQAIGCATGDEVPQGDDAAVDGSIDGGADGHDARADRGFGHDVADEPEAGPPCDAGMLLCDGSGCVDPTSDPSNCGKCGTACAPGLDCVASACTCTTGSCTGCCADAGCMVGDENGACGSGGIACATCTGTDNCNGGVCGECAPGATDSIPCGTMCQTQKRTCDSTGHWGPFGPCNGGGSCMPDSSTSCACGLRWLCNGKCQWNLDFSQMDCDACAPQKPPVCLEAGAHTDLGVIECFAFTCCSGGSGGQLCNQTCN